MDIQVMKAPQAKILLTEICIYIYVYMYRERERSEMRLNGMIRRRTYASSLLKLGDCMALGW